MLRNQYFRTRSPQERQRVTRHQFSLVTNHWLLPASLIFVLLISGCGGEEAVDKPIVESVGGGNPINDVPISTPYYPMTLGSRWVYRNADGSKWTRVVTNANFLNTHNTNRAHSFSYNRPLEKDQLNFFQARSNIATPGRIIHPISPGEIGITDRNEKEIDIPYSIRIRIVEDNGNVKRFGYLGPFTYSMDILERSNYFAFLKPPLVPGKTWRVFGIGLRIRHDSAVFSHVLEAHSVISARINEELQTVATPEGRFEGCIEIEYYETPSVETTKIETDLIPVNHGKERAFLKTKIRELAAAEILNQMPKLSLGTLWLAPGVGPVKIETPIGIAELIDYAIK